MSDYMRVTGISVEGISVSYASQNEPRPNVAQTPVVA